MIVDLDDLSEVIVLGATNRPDLLDPALLSPGRFPFVLEFPLPAEAARLQILAVHTARMPLADDVDLADLARQSDGLAGSDLAALCQRAALGEIREVVQAERRGAERTSRLRISRRQFDQAMTQIRVQAARAMKLSSVLHLPATNPTTS